MPSCCATWFRVTPVPASALICSQWAAFWSSRFFFAAVRALRSVLLTRNVIRCAFES
ncbi:hypothetical protein D3C81_2098900 [compost metagenome]